MGMMVNEALAAPLMHFESDRYAIEVRYVGDEHWVENLSFPDFYDALYAAEIVRDLNKHAVDVVYRSVLVSCV